MRALSLLFFASGCAALIYETVWFHLVQLVVGASSISVAVLLRSFMGGIALGSAWLAFAARVMADGTVRDVRSGTGAGQTKEYYLNRPVVNGVDDRGGAMAPLAALEVETLRRGNRP